MMQYKIKDKRGYDFSISRISQTEFRIRYYHPFKKQYLNLLTTRSGLSRYANNSNCCFRDEAFRLITENILPQLSLEYEEDELTKKVRELYTTTILLPLLKKQNDGYYCCEAVGDKILTLIREIAKIDGIA